LHWDCLNIKWNFYYSWSLSVIYLHQIEPMTSNTTL
jgi:hypothetical protein